MVASDSKQLKVTFPIHLYEALLEESNSSGVPMASLIKLAVKDRYVIADEDQPVPSRLTEKRLAANGAK